MTRKVRYIAGRGCELARPLSNGLVSFEAGMVYEVTPADLVRLTKNGEFEEAVDAYTKEEIEALKPSVPQEAEIEEVKEEPKPEVAKPKFGRTQVGE